MTQHGRHDVRRSTVARTEEQQATRVVSGDGTEIGFFSSGAGPPLVLVHGLLGDHTRWEAMRPYLEPHFTVHAMDRRGRGASGDAPEYAFERECEDVVAVADAVAEASGTAVDLFGSSGGALYSLQAAARGAKVRRLVLFEPPTAEVVRLLPAALLERLDALLAEGDREGVVVESYRAVVGLSDEEIDHLRAQPAWPNRVAAAHTVPRELRIPPDKAFSAEQAKAITVPALVLVGSDTPRPFRTSAEAVAAALPNARLVILEGQGHGAELLAPGTVAESVLAFLRERSER
jgi:pimeloyl-ACP methyl ester carboxylesterase